MKRGNYQLRGLWSLFSRAVVAHLPKQRPSQAGTGLASFSSKVMLHLLPAGKVKNFMTGTIISSVMSLLILAPRSSRKKRAVASRSSNLASGMPMQLRDPRPKGWATRRCCSVACSKRVSSNLATKAG